MAQKIASQLGASVLILIYVVFIYQDSLKLALIALIVGLVGIWLERSRTGVYYLTVLAAVAVLITRLIDSLLIYSWPAVNILMILALVSAIILFLDNKEDVKV